MALKDIHKMTIEEAMLLASKGLCFIIKDGKLKGFTNNIDDDKRRW